jgi:hypothetical protein
MDEKPLKITEYKKENHNEKRTILLIPIKDGSKWQYVNLTKGYICPCQFNTREEALLDFVKYSNKFFRVEFEELDV